MCVLYALVSGAAIKQFARIQMGNTFEDYNWAVQRKIFWMLLLVLGLMADIVLPLLWAALATIPIVIVSWWVAYRSEWF